MPSAHARPIRTARDHKHASTIADRMLKQTRREPDAGRRLQALLEEIEKFDGAEDLEDPGDPVEDVDGLHRRRWSDDAE